MLRHSPVPEWAETVSAPGANAAGQGSRVSTKCSILSRVLTKEIGCPTYCSPGGPISGLQFFLIECRLQQFKDFCILIEPA